MSEFTEKELLQFEAISKKKSDFIEKHGRLKCRAMWAEIHSRKKANKRRSDES